MKIKKINKSNTDYQDKDGCFTPKLYGLTNRQFNKKLNSIIYFVSNNDVKNFEKIDDYYIVTYKDNQIWKFKGFELVGRIETELQIILNRPKKEGYNIF